MSVEIAIVHAQKRTLLCILVTNAGQVADHLGLQLNGHEVENGRVVLADQTEALLPERGLSLLADAGEDIPEL